MAASCLRCRSSAISPWSAPPTARSLAIPATVAAAPEEIDYLCQVVNAHFRTTIAAGRCGVVVRGRALARRRRLGPAAGTPRDYELAVDRKGAPLVTVIGGKITTFRRLAEAVLDALAPVLDARPAWTPIELCRAATFRSAGSRRSSPRRVQFAVSERAACAAPDRRLRNARASHSGGRANLRRPRAADGRQSHRSGAALSRPVRMGTDRRRRAVAAEQARPALHATGTGAACDLHGRPHRRRRDA